MTWEDARAALARGEAVRRRETWCTWVRRENGALRFQLKSAALCKEYGACLYRPTPIDRAATDWEARA